MAEPDLPSLIGIDAWDGQQPVILVTDPDYMPPIAENYPRAAVVALPPGIALWALADAWCWWMQLFRADCTLWPVSGQDELVLAHHVAPNLDVAGIRTLRRAVRRPDDWARYERVETVWKDRTAIYSPDWLTRADELLRACRALIGQRPIGGTLPVPASTPFDAVHRAQRLKPAHG